MTARTLMFLCLSLVSTGTACEAETDPTEPAGGPVVVEDNVPDSPLETQGELDAVSALADATSQWEEPATPRAGQEPAGQEPVGPDAGDDEQPEPVEIPESPEDEGTSAPVSKGACDNPTDEDLLVAQEDLDGVVMTCALNCIGEEACSTNCMIEATGLSEPCSACFAGTISCTMKNCVFQCLNAESTQCKDCQESNCFEDFEACAGLDPPGE